MATTSARLVPSGVDFVPPVGPVQDAVDERRVPNPAMTGIVRSSEQRGRFPPCTLDDTNLNITGYKRHDEVECHERYCYLAKGIHLAVLNRAENQHGRVTDGENPPPVLVSEFPHCLLSIQLTIQIDIGQPSTVVAVKFSRPRLTGKVPFPKIGNSVGASAEIEEEAVFCEFSASSADVFSSVSDFVTDFGRRLADCRVLSNFRQIFEDSIVGTVRHPVRRSAHKQKSGHGDLIISLGSNYWPLGVDYVPWEHFCTRGRCFVVETTEGLSPSLNQRRTGAATPALGGLVSKGDETMYESDHGTEIGIERDQTAGLQEGECPNCEAAITGVATAGPGANYAQPCGCQIADFAMRELVATDGGRR